MDNFIVSARKYRPATFETVVGQQHITNTLKNAIKNNQLAQAFLFCGPRGVGKTTCARILAKTINCTNLQPNGEACGECPSCKAFENGNSFNVHELDAASNNSVDDIRSLIEQVRIPPQAARYKVYIIDEVHMLSQAAFNAFLKTLEEPPHYAIFILATTEKHKILPTILSRCQIFDFNRIKVDDMAAHLASIAGKESISYEPDGLHIIAQKADGGLRDALSMFDQIVSFSGGKVTYRSVIDNLNILDYDYYFNITESLLKEDTAKVLLFFDEILSRGFDGAHFIAGLSEHFRNLLVSKDQSTLKLLEVSEGIKSKYLQQSQAGSVSFLLSAMNIANQCDISYKLSKNQRLQVELALLKMCHLPSAFNMAITPLNGTSTNEGPLKKKPDTPAIAPVSSDNSVVETRVLSDAQPVYNKTTPIANGQPATPVQSVPVKEAQPSPVVTPRPPVLMPRSSTLTPSLTDIAKTEEEILEEEDPYLKGEARQDFTMDDFLKHWSDFAAKVKADGKKNLVTIFTSNAPRMIRPYEFEVVVGNMVQENLFKEERPEMHNFLRSKLNNFSIEVHARVDEQKVVRKPYTAIEKFQYMANRHPDLMDLRNRFNLDFD
ncbi:DNA polymerase III subunit gamma/tau [Mucilaginibacter dorajii]|uniref:DNA polymerase III subunit gamma/tau n=1 Tax=Mucilaginibacter dorajii TaxID=692994 RepID=A0ABP7PKV5_9SPHI|nr:DNA polymerase III subunit gamma/tau [Mucilaginibacter dorajii]MCS3733628.1 DNA polymerase-3 subunit gamma/tau [Mucilaginibacter dorajii]